MKPPTGGLEVTLPSSWYFQPSVFNLESEHIFFKEWLCVGREEQLEHRGDHQVFDVAGQSILVVRSAEGQLRAFYNVCRHRGARLCEERSGDSPGFWLNKGGVVGSRSIICPYHSWKYNLDGQLVFAPNMAGVAGFDPASIQLHSVGVELWGGFVFVNLSPVGAPSFASTLGSIRDRLARYPLSELRTAKVIRYDVQANWKVLCENYNECYHCGPVHPELCSLVPAFREAGGANLDWERGIPHREGADTFTLSGRSTRRSFTGLSEDELVRHKGELAYPNLFVSLAREHVAAFVLEPKSAQRTIVSCMFLFEPYEMAQSGFDPNDVVEFWDRVNRQDWAICENVQRGMSARVHKSGLMAPMEDQNLDIRRYVTDRIGAYA